ncbi:magnesium-translocating P-type ATPase [Streptomyces nanshensis]|uniref:Magnesium-transporting ATPase, P-type 1 n=1 Tax=Streptomyces nanshensis TaxID=518642 RepID=A0A1E7LBI7_9ACTN|nr:magnesium-translocating P-type ATPase [Streptomyces nanshensis]
MVVGQGPRGTTASASTTEAEPGSRLTAVSGAAEPTALQALRALGSGPRGLSEQEAERRLTRYGENVPPSLRPLSWPRRLVRGLKDPFTAVLLVLGLVSAAVASWGTAVVITVLVAVSCLLRAGGEMRADRAMAGLRDLVATTATVLRRPEDESGAGGAAPVARELPVDQLVPGDVVQLGAGDLVPADVRVMRGSGLRVREAAFTGESVAVKKYPVDAPHSPSQPEGAGAFDRPYLCFQGSSVVAGGGTAVVVATGSDTRLAAAHTGISARAAGSFDRLVHGVSWILVRFMLLTPPLVLMANAALRGQGLETLPFAVAVAVALTPEMLPVVVTTCLARGASLLARDHRAIVRRLPALHDLGAMDVLCLDKTGTLTQDRPLVGGSVDGMGREDPEVLQWAAVNAWWTLQLADLPVPDPLDEAILAAADEGELVTCEPVAALPFDPVRRLATAVVRTPGRLGTNTLIVKGSIEAVLERCVLPDAERQRLNARAASHAADGLRLLAVATVERPTGQRSYTPADERGLTFRGFVLLRDAVTDSAAAALCDLAERGVSVKVLTGDHPGTAARACRDLGFEPGEVLTAERLDALSEADLAAAVSRASVIARCTPEHKARVVSALRRAGHTTGFLGDGVNDLPALRAADVGIGPRDAVPVAREGADVVLAGREKDLTAIGHAITTGRYASGNIAAYLRVTLSSNLGNVIAMLTAGVLLPFLPMLPTQVLVQNLCFDAAQLAFAYDRPRPTVLRRPTTLNARDLLTFITRFGVLNALADLATFGLLTLAVYGPGGDDEAVFHTGWFTENMLTQALVMVLLHTGRRAAEHRGRNRALGPVGWAAALLAVIGVLLPLSPFGPPLGMTSLPQAYYAQLIAVLALYAVALTALVRREAEHV